MLAAALLAELAFGEDDVSIGSCKGVALAGRSIQRLDLATSFDFLHLAFVRGLKESLQAKVVEKVGARYTDEKVNEAIALLDLISTDMKNIYFNCDIIEQGYKSTYTCRQSQVSTVL